MNTGLTNGAKNNQQKFHDLVEEVLGWVSCLETRYEEHKTTLEEQLHLIDQTTDQQKAVEYTKNANNCKTYMNAVVNYVECLIKVFMIDGVKILTTIPIHYPTDDELCVAKNEVSESIQALNDSRDLLDSLEEVIEDQKVATSELEVLTPWLPVIAITLFVTYFMSTILFWTMIIVLGIGVYGLIANYNFLKENT